jgi:hypothetical protein
MVVYVVGLPGTSGKVAAPKLSLTWRPGLL